MSFGVDLGSSAVKVVALRRTLKGWKVIGAARRRVPRVAKPEDLKPVLCKVLFDLTAERGGKGTAVVGLSGRDINLQVVLQPQMKPVNYRMMMRYELDQRKGESADLYLDYCTLREPDSYFPHYLAMVGIGKSAYVNDRIEILSRASLATRDAVPNPYALYAAYKNAYGVEGGMNAILDIGADNMDFALVRGGKLVYARNISSGARIFDTQVAGMANCGPEEGEWMKVKYASLAADEGDPKEGEIRPAVRTGAGQLSGFISSSINHAKMQLQEKELTVDKLYLSGGGARIKGFPEYLTSSLKIPVELLDPFKNMDTKIVDAQGSEEFRQLPTDMAVAVGLSQLGQTTTEKATLSILPDDLRKRRDFFRSMFYLGVGGAAVALVLVVLTVIGLARSGSQASELAEFRSKTGANSQKIRKMTALEAQQRDAAAKAGVLTEQTVTGAGVLDAVMKLKRGRKDKAEGVSFKEVKFLEPVVRDRDAPAREVGVFHCRGKGFVMGEITRQPDSIRVREVDYALADVEGLLTWPSGVKSILITGEIDESIKDGSKATLDDLKTQLTNESRGTVASIKNQRASDKQGWRVFDILVEFK